MRFIGYTDFTRGSGQITTLFLDFRALGQDNIAPVTEPVTIQRQEDLAQMSDWPVFTRRLVANLVKAHAPNGITVVISKQSMTIHAASSDDIEHVVNKALDTGEFVLAPKAERIPPRTPEYSNPWPRVQRPREATVADYL